MAKAWERDWSVGEIVHQRYGNSPPVASDFAAVLDRVLEGSSDENRAAAVARMNFLIMDGSQHYARVANKRGLQSCPAEELARAHAAILDREDFTTEMLVDALSYFGTSGTAMGQVLAEQDLPVWEDELWQVARGTLGVDETKLRHARLSRPQPASTTAEGEGTVALPTTLDFICNRDTPGVLSRFWTVAGIYPARDSHQAGGRATPSSPGDSPSTHDGVVSSMPLWIEISKIDDYKSQVRLASDAAPFSESHRMEVLQQVKRQLDSEPEEPAGINSLTDSGFSYIATYRNDSHTLTSEVASAQQEESPALRTDTGSVLLRMASFGLVDFPRRRLVVALNLLTRNHMPMHGIQPYPGVPEVPLEEIPGVRVLNLNNPADAFSLSVSPDGRMVATIYYAGRGFISLCDANTGHRELVTSLEDMAGYERPIFSPDGEWMLIEGYRGTRIVRCSDGATLSIPELTGGTCWYELEHRLGLLCIGAGSGDQLLPERIVFMDLETVTPRHVGDVIASDPLLPPGRRRLSHPTSGPDGRILVGSSFGPSSEYQKAHGSRNRVAILDMNTLRLTHFVKPFADEGGVIEREHKMWSWNSPFVSTQTLRISDSLLNTGVPRSSEPEPAEEEYQEQTLLLVDFNSPLVTGKWG